MPPVRHKDSGVVTEVSDEQAADLVGSGRFELAGGGTVEVRSKTGGRVRVGGNRILADDSLTAVTVDEQAQAARTARLERQHADGILNKAKAVGEGFVSGATFGLADPLLEDEATAARRELLSTWRGAGEIAGMIAPAFATGGAGLGAGGIRGAGGLARATLRYTPAGLTARLGGRIAQGGGAKALVAAGAAEGAIGNAGYYLSDVALGKRDLSAEGFVGAMGEGALWGSAGGGAAHLVERGLVRARSMFPRLAGKTAKADAELAERAFDEAAEESLQAGDDLVIAARERVAAAREKLGMNRVSQAEQRVALERARRAGDDAGVKAAQDAMGDLRLDSAEQKLVIARKGAPAPDAPGVPAAAAADDAVPPAVDSAAPDSPIVAEGSAPGIPTAGVDADQLAALQKGNWTPEALDDSARLADMLGQRPRVKEAADVDRLAALADNLEARQSDVRDWIKRTKDKVGPQWVKRTPENGAWNRGNADLQVEIVGMAPDEKLAWRRPASADDVDGAEIYEDYNDLLKRAAMESDDAVRDSLVREAAFLEEQAFDAAPSVLNRETLAAREKLGWDSMSLAQKRLEREVAKIGRMSEETRALYASGERAPFQPTPLGRESTQIAMEDDILRRQYADVPFGQRLDGGVDRSPGRLVADAEEASKVLGEHAKAHAAIVAELGEAAPPGAVAQAEAYTQAVDDVARKNSERMAQVSDDVAEEAAGAGAAKASGKTKRKGKRAQEGVEAGAEEAEEGRFRRMAGRAADIGMVIEAMQTAGLPLPDLDKLPVIGPVLGLYLKARAVKAVAGRLGGRVPATAEARVASKAASTRDRVAGAVDRMLGLGERAARRMKPQAARTAVLAHQLFDDGEGRGKADDDATRTTHRMAELAAAEVNPNAVRRAVRRQLADAVDPDMVRAIEEVAIRKLGYLAKHMPKEPPASLLGRHAWKPSRSEVERFARRVKAAEDPASVFDDLSNGTVTPEAAETLRSVYPELFAEAQARLIERSVEVSEALPYQRVVKLSALFDAPLVPSMRPERIAAYQPQQPSPQAQGGGVQGVGGPPPAPVNMDALYMSPADRRAQGR